MFWKIECIPWPFYNVWTFTLLSIHFKIFKQPLWTQNCQKTKNNNHNAEHTWQAYNDHKKLTLSQKLSSEIKPPIFSVSLKTKLTGWLFTWHNLKCAIWSQVYCCLTLTVHQCFQVNFEFLLKLLWSGQNKNNKTEQFIYESRNLSIEYYVLCDSICDVSRLGFIHEWVTTCMAMQSQNDEIPRNQKTRSYV